MYKAIMYVMQGPGASTIWQEGERKRSLEWQEGSLVAIPLYESNVIADIRSLPLDEWREKGFRTSIMRISIASTSIGMHIADVSEGTYAVLP
jgi:hypothetical protein